MSDSPDPSSVFASAADPASDPPTPEEVDVARFNAEVRLMLHGPQREEGREVQRVQVDTLTWVAPEDDLPDEATEEEAAASFNSLFR